MKQSLAARAAALGAALFVSCGIAHADPVFRALTFAGVATSTIPDGAYRLEEQGGTYFNSPRPDDALMRYEHTYTGGPQGDTTFLATAAADPRGFFSSGNFAGGSILNAYPGWADGPQGYYIIGGFGSWTQHRFVSPESVFGPYSVFHWHVSGRTLGDFGRITSRLDFSVTTGVTSFDQFYDPAISPNLMTEFGPGSWSYYTAIEMDTPLDFLFWSSAFWEIKRSDLATLTAPRDLFGSAEFMSTFELDRIDLFNADGTPVNNWELLDDATGNAIFNQNGRIGAFADVPEPGTLALAAAGLLPIVGIRLRRR